MEISLGIITYDELDYLNALLQSIKTQKLNKISIVETIIVSTKKDEEGINKILSKINLKNVNLLLEKKPKGKYHAVNIFLKAAKSEILVLASGDITLSKNTIEQLVNPLNEEKIGIVASRPIPQERGNNSFLNYTIQLLWYLHHKISLDEPKFGEVIAFRNLNFQLKKTSVDEEMIAEKIINSGFKKKYSDKAIVFNTGPKTISDYIFQRRRIYCGHLNLKKKKHYNVPTLNSINIINYLFLLEKKWFQPLKLTYAIVLEGVSRILGFFDYLSGKENIKWKRIKR